ncbi:hypothetical protein E3N88_28972 [Mikania micrantha]|uniref:Uncharacterized protein n=1 Tax=Mikania micrantha TaxID=192012 RepID=A0A5N6N1J7_9ASTR|nr:hypothetical protein E3N88_28972 [Mikania micrantha]
MGVNFFTWMHHLRKVLRIEGKLYALDNPINPEPPIGCTTSERMKHNGHELVSSGRKRPLIEVDEVQYIVARRLKSSDMPGSSSMPCYFNIFLELANL